jgi:arsenate reductase
MTYTVYIYSKCSTCQQARRFLEQHQITFESQEIVQTPPSLEELHKMLKFQNGDIKKLFNTSGMLYKELGLSQKLPTMMLEEALHLLASHGMLVKRPFLIGEKLGLLGFHEQKWKASLVFSKHID